MQSNNVSELLNNNTNQPAPFAPPQPLQPMQLESASTALAAQAKAAVEARYVMAMHRPRNWQTVRQNILAECQRPSFAHNASAIYRKPIGKGVEGLGIRYVEVALRCMTNVLIETAMIYEDDLKEIHRVSVTDLEANLTYPIDIRVSRTVERSKPESDGSYISVRLNSYGKQTYTVKGTDDDLLNKRGALISKAIRTLGLRIIPGDIQDESMDTIKRIRKDKAARDPAGEAKKIIDAFGSINVKVSSLVEYLGHELEICSPSELVELRGIYGAIKDGESSWASVMENREPPKSQPKQPDSTAHPHLTDNGYVDSTGELYDTAKHAGLVEGVPPINNDGAFKKKRGTAKPVESQLTKAVERMKSATSLDQLDEIAGEYSFEGDDKTSFNGFYDAIHKTLSVGDDSGLE